MHARTRESGSGHSLRIVSYVERRGHQRKLGQLVGVQVNPLPFDGDLLDLLEGPAPLIETIRRAAEAPRGDPIPLDAVRLSAPLLRPGKILAIGLNYADHRAESPMRAEAPPYPEGFVKLSSSIIGPEDPIVSWPDVTELDYEVELAAVIGRTAHYVPASDALEYVAGYMVANDISARDWQRSERSRGRSPLMGKSFPSFCPLGPWLVTSDEVSDPQNLALELRVNGEVRQSASTAKMLFTVADCVSHWSKLRLEPGDLILTGTPAGVAWARKPDPSPYWLKVGDLVEAEVERIGTLRNRVVAPSAERTEAL